MVDQEGTLRQIRSAWVQDGFTGGEECMQIAGAALRYLGQAYEMLEELDQDTVDCSTLTCQAHWLGAIVGIPFRAQSQRDASNAVEIHQDLLPGDVVVKYQHYSYAPDGRHNHVGVYLGRDRADIEWVIESKSEEGVRLTRLEEFDPEGGVRRFAPSPREVFSGWALDAAQTLARSVPKLGRLGARQYVKGNGERVKHEGQDIYCKEDATVVAPLDGVATSVRVGGHVSGLEIRSDRLGLVVRLGNVMGDERIESGATVHEGSTIGAVTVPGEDEIIEFSSVNSSRVHLHFECLGRDGEALNGIYQVKRARLSPPVLLEELNPTC